jgi:hypothetical protein
MTENEKTPQQMAAEIIGAMFDADDPGTSSVIDQIVAALDEAGLLIDPVENGMWQNLARGHMTCTYKDGQLRFKLTEAGEEYVKNMINRAGD